MDKTQNVLLAFVGMPGSGKTLATQYCKDKGFASVRFGDVTDTGLQKEKKEINPENEEVFREALRARLGMAAYAIESLPKLEKMMTNTAIGVIDGLYSWEEYVFLKQKFPHLLLIHIYAEPVVRYARLSHRKIRPLTQEQALMRDHKELEKLNKGGPIAIADYVIVNNSDAIADLHQQIDSILNKIQAI